MAKLSIDDLKKIKEKTAKDISLRSGPSNIKITVHMGTCGIAAGARDVMSSLMEVLAESGRDDIRVVNSGCMGMCSSEPNVTVEIKDQEPIVYQLVVQTDFALGKI
ncbi:MAG: (2Fe-2S) ferredoxin domain-containing protein [Deltaproteobacteria bacterium]|nr:(2Fe-2S) ferredoxin domain-containing protein [Deltaproteobacteria bacterium]